MLHKRQREQGQLLRAGATDEGRPIMLDVEVHNKHTPTPTLGQGVTDHKI